MGVGLYYFNMKTETPPPTPTPTPAVIPTPVPTPTPGPLAIANLISLKPPVTFRRTDELVWKDASMNLPLFKNDSVKTHLKAATVIKFAPSTELNVGENTLVVVNLDYLDSTNRATLMHGSVVPKFNKDLWLLTSAALIKLRPNGKAGQGAAQISIEPGKFLNVTLKNGQGTLVRRDKSKKVIETKLKLNSKISVKAPKKVPSFDESFWTGGPIVENQVPKPVEAENNDSKIRRRPIKVRK